MRRSRGRRFDDGPKLNMKKVIATVIALIVIILVVASIILALEKKNKEKLNIESPIKYFSAYVDSKWGVINSKGEQLQGISYDDMIIVPDSSKAVFVVSHEVDYQNGISKTKAINDRNEQLFIGRENVNAIINYNSIDDVWYNADVLTYQANGKYGLIDFSGNEVLAAEYDDIASLKGIMKALIVKKDGICGLFNTSSKTMTISPMYTEIKAFGETYNDGYIVKDVNGKYGLISSDGKIILENRYDEIKTGTGSSDKFVVKDGVKTKLIAKDGSSILETGFDDIEYISGENLIVRKTGKYGIITTGGDIVIDAAYDTIKPCFGDYYIVENARKYGIINTLKDIVIDIKYSNIEYRSDIVSILCENEDFTTDVYTRDFKYVLTGTITKADTELGYIRARVGSDYKYYNLQYQEVSNRDVLKNNTIFLIKENGKYGYVNRDNQKIVECIYDDATEQNECGFAAINKDGKWGVLQSNGAVFMEPSVELTDNLYIDFIGTWHLSENTELNAYTK